MDNDLINEIINITQRIAALEIKLKRALITGPISPDLDAVEIVQLVCKLHSQATYLVGALKERG